MASLTDQLSTGMDIKPIRQAPEPNNGLASALNALSKGIEVFSDSRKQESATRRQEAADARQAKKDAYDEQAKKLPGEFFDQYQEAEQDNRGRLVAPDPSEVLTVTQEGAPGAVFGDKLGGLTGEALADANRMIASLENTRTAVGQKRMPGISLQAAITARIGALLNKYPEHSGQLLELAEKKGFNSQLFRAAQDEESGHEATREGDEKLQEDMYKLGATNTPPEILSTQTRDQVIAGGFKTAYTQNLLDAASKQAELTLKRVNISEAEKKSAQEDLDNSTIQTLTIGALNDTNGLYTALQQHVLNINKLPVGSAEQKAEWEKFGPIANQYKENYRRQVLAQAANTGASKEAIASAMTNVETMFNGLNDFWSGEMSVATANTRALTALGVAAKTDATKLLPVYMAIKEIGFPVAEIEGLALGLSENPILSEKLRKEMQGFVGEFGTKRASSHLMDIVRILKGETTLAKFDPAEARIKMPTLYSTSKALVNAYGSGKSDNGDAMLNGVGEIITASRTLSPATASLNVFVNATSGFALANSRKALLRALKDPNLNDQAEATIMGSRAASAGILIALNRPKAFASENTKHWEAAIDKTTGLAKIVSTGAGPVRLAIGGANQDYRGSAPSYTKGSIPNKPEGLENLVNIYNRNLENVVQLNPHDPSGIKGATPLEIQKYYSLGIAPKSMKTEKAINPNKEIEKSRQAVEDAFEKTPTMNTDVQIKRDNYDTVFGHGKYGKPDKPLTSMKIGEATAFGDNVLKPATRAAGIGKIDGEVVGTSAIGAYQIVGSTMRKIAPKVFGDEWRQVPFTVENQDKLGEYLFEQNKNKNLQATWEGLPDRRPGAYADMSWNEVKKVIQRYESA